MTTRKPATLLAFALALLGFAGAQKFLFVSNRVLGSEYSRQNDVFLYRDGSELRLTHTLRAHEYDPVASLDGRLIAYAVREEPATVDKGDNWYWKFEVMDVLLSRPLASWQVPGTRGMTRPAGGFNLTWLPEGGSFLAQVPGNAGEWEIHRFTVGTDNSELVGRGFGIVLSPDGRRLATERNGVVYVLELDTGRETPLAAGTPLGWAGNTHVFVARTDGLDLIELGTQARRSLHSFYGKYTDFSWSPDGRHYALSLVQDDQWFLIFVTRDHAFVEDYLIPGAIYGLEWLDNRAVIFSFLKEAGDLAIAMLDLDGYDPLLVDTWADDYGAKVVPGP